MPQQSQNNKSFCLLLLEILVILGLFMGLILGLIYYFGAEKPHIEIPHSLNQVFHTQEQADLITKLQRKANQYTTLWGANETGIFQFLEHYADIRAAKGTLVIVRRVQNNLYETALKFIRYTKDFIESNIDLETDVDKIEWVFIIKNGEIPLQEINGLISRRPKDKIVIGIEEKSNVKGFKKLEYPAILLADIQSVIQEEFNISTKAAEILTNFYGTVPQILHHLDEISYTHQKHLGDNYQDLKHLSAKQLKTLKNLCKDGEAKIQGNSQLLSQIGIEVYDNVAYWSQRINRLNYELGVETQCVDQVIPEEIRVKIEQQKEEQAQAEARQSSREKNDQRVKNRKQKQQKQTKTSKSKNTKKSAKKTK